MADKFTNQFSDNLRVARSHSFAAVDDATYNVIRLPRYSLVMDVWLWVSTAYIAGAPVITIGFTGNGETADVDGFMTNSISLPQQTGMKRASMGSAPWGNGKYFNAASGVLTVTVAAGSATTEGTFTVFCSYSIVH